MPRNEIYVGRFNRALQKLFGIKGGLPAPFLAGEIIPVNAHFTGRENRYLESWHVFSLGDNRAAVAANSAVWQLRNPPTSNVIAVIEKLTWAKNGNDRVDVSMDDTTTADLTTTKTPGAHDNRGPAAAACILSTQDAGAVPLGTILLSAQTVINFPSLDLILDESQEIPVLPKRVIRVQGITQNALAVLTIQWRERFLEEGERT